VAIKLTNLEQLAEQYNQKEYYFKDLHLDFTVEGAFSYADKQRIKGNDVKEDFDVNAIKNSLRNLFNTTPGQRFLFPEYGLSLHHHLFEQITEDNAKILGNKIVAAIKKFEPRVTTERCIVTGDPDLNLYEIDLEVKVPIFNSNLTINTSLNTINKTFVFEETSKYR
jgi:phage baseplate assembly protein W